MSRVGRFDIAGKSNKLTKDKGMLPWREDAALFGLLEVLKSFGS